MSVIRLDPLPYSIDATDWFACVRGWPYPVLLDSAKHPAGRFDLIAADPDRVIQLEHGQHAAADQSALHPLIEALGSPDPSLATEDWPFAGGAIGVLGYELTHGQPHLPERTADGLLPDLHVGFYRWAIMRDHRKRRAVLMTTCEVSDTERTQLLNDLAQVSTAQVAPFSLTSAFTSNMGMNGYQTAFERVVDYIRNGDCYQVNLAQRLSAHFSGDPFSAFCTLREVMRSPFSAYVEIDQGALISLSPERLLLLDDGVAEARPIKGTAARDASPDKDRQVVSELVNSEKNRAENLMIVDLLRNDLGKHAETGSVEVDRLFELESYANVHHLVSVIRARLATGHAPLSLLEGCFPGGSITGAPKLRAMQVIDEVEPDVRSAYCGSVFYASHCGRLDANINIRSLVCHDGRIHCWGGGGIVADSDCHTEYQESLLKIAPILEALERLSASG